MKNTATVLRISSAILVTIVALVFTVMETTLLITLDFLLYENVLIALLQLLLRLSISVYALLIGTLPLLKRSRVFIIEGICLFAFSFVMIPFVSNNFGVYFTIISAFFALSQLIWQKTRA
jgi:hypothetical protein